MTAKDRWRIIYMEYLSNPENPPMLRTEMIRNVLKTSKTTFYRNFTPDDADKMDAEALELRRAAVASRSVHVDEALYKRCLVGDAQAIKLWYQRLEGWSERQVVAVQDVSEDDLRRHAQAKGYDVERYLETYRRAKHQLSTRQGAGKAN